MTKKADRDEKTGRFLKGNLAPVKHFGYSKSRNVPLKVRKFITATREAMIKDLAQDEAGLTTSQLILIDKAVNILQVTLCIESFIRREGVFRGKKLEPVLANNYLAYINSLRIILRELGISTKASERILSIAEIIKEAEEEARKEKQVTDDVKSD